MNRCPSGLGLPFGGRPSGPWLRVIYAVIDFLTCDKLGSPDDTTIQVFFVVLKSFLNLPQARQDTREKTKYRLESRHLVSVLGLRSLPSDPNPLFIRNIPEFGNRLELAGHLLSSKVERGNNPLLKISIHYEKPLATLAVEGKLVGPWALELGNTWHELCAPLGRKRLRVDLRGVTFVDAHGTRVLKEIVKATGAEIFADSPLTKDFANRVRQDTAKEETE